MQTKKRASYVLVTIVLAIIFAIGIAMYARGFSFDLKDKTLLSSGLLVVKSVPDGAEVYIDGDLEVATNDSLRLAPGNYDVAIKKDGFHPWEKRMTIYKEEVTEATAHLFKSAPSLAAISYSGAFNPIPTKDFSKFAYTVPVSSDDPEDGGGLWVMETVNLPIGFDREPRQITDGDLENATWEWSPDGREILLTTSSGIYLLDAGEFTPQNSRINISSTVGKTRTEWQEKEQKKLDSKIEKLPKEVQDVLDRKASSIVFSADNDMVLYTASGSATLESDLIDPVPGSSNQEQERNIEEGRTYVYDIKEDRNFLVSQKIVVLGDNPLEDTKRRITWFPTSRHLVVSEEEKITIMDIDGTNKVEVYSGNYETPHAFPIASTDRLIILTNLGANSTLPNLYSLDLK